MTFFEMPSKAVGQFVLSNTLLPLFDMFTDCRLVFFYFCAAAYNPHWGLLTLMWIWMPWCVHASKYFYNLLFDRDEADFYNLLLHIPFMLPARNLYFACRLHILRFGKEDFDTKNWKQVEDIQNQVGLNNRR